jgi:hypothetical protein
LSPASGSFAAGGVAGGGVAATGAGVGADGAAGWAFGVVEASRRRGRGTDLLWTITRRCVTVAGRGGVLSRCVDTGRRTLVLCGRGAGSDTAWTERSSDDGGAVIGRPVSEGVPTKADIATTPAIAPVISAAARTRAHVSLMLLPRSVDTSFKGSIGTTE